MNRLQSIEHRDALDAVFASFVYELDPVGNRTAVTEHDGRRVEYDYDELYRLTGEDIFSPGAVLASRTFDYEYDLVGNRLSRNDSADGLTTYDYDDNDRLLQETTGGVDTDYTYDDNGNTLSKISLTDRVFYEWNVENRLIAADTDGDGTNDVTYEYDADGTRVSQTVNGEETRLLLDKNRPYAQVLEEYTPGGIIKVSYVHGHDLISQNRPADTGKSFYHYDGLGSTRALSNALGLATDGYIYDAFGQLISSTDSTPNLYLFAGEQRDANLGLDYLRARYLNPSFGRFINRDTFNGIVADPITLNKYLYSNDNPVNYIDPSGNISIGGSLTGVAISSALNTLRFVGLASFDIGFGVASAIIIKTSIEPGIRARLTGLELMAAGMPGGDDLYLAGSKLISAGAFFITNASDAIDIGKAGVGIANAVGAWAKIYARRTTSTIITNSGGGALVNSINGQKTYIIRTAPKLGGSIQDVKVDLVDFSENLNKLLDVADELYRLYYFEVFNR